MGSNANASWQADWNRFVDHIAEAIRDGETAESLGQRIGGKSVSWNGVLAKKRIDSMAATVTIQLPAREMDFGNGRRAVVKGISLPLSKDSIADWEAVEVGSKVGFRAKMGAGDSPFPPVEVKDLSGGKTVVMLRFSDGKLGQ